MTDSSPESTATDSLPQSAMVQRAERAELPDARPATPDARVDAERRFRRTVVRVFFAVVSIVVLIGGYQGWHAWGRYRLASLEERCRTARTNKDWIAERSAAEAWTKIEPNSGDAWFFLAEAWKELDDIPRAVDCLGHVPPTHPKFALAWLVKADIEWSTLNDPVAFLKSYERVIEVEPKAIQAHSRIISFYAFTLQRPQMLRAIRRAIEYGGDSREAYVYQVLADELVFTNAMDVNARWMNADPVNETYRVGLAVQTAMHLSINADATALKDDMEKETEGIRRLTEFLETYPHNAVLLSVLMEYYVKNGDVEKVATLLAQVPDSAAENHMLWTYRGWYHTVQGEFDEAETAFEKALQLHPLSWRARHEYATLLRRLQRHEDAEENQRLADMGRIGIRNQLIRLQSVGDASTEQLQQIESYARQCGDLLTADTLRGRLPSQ